MTTLATAFNLPVDRVLLGTPAMWNAEAKWIDRDGLPIPPGPHVGLGQRTFLRTWKDKRPIDIIQPPLPNVDELNAKIPKPWPVGLNGQEEPPYALHYVVYFCDPTTGSLYSYINKTWGAQLAYMALEEKITVMRALRGTNVIPIIKLAQCPMKTKVGLKMRPHFNVLEFRTVGGGGEDLIPSTAAPQLTGPPPAAAAAPAPQAAPETTQAAASALDHLSSLKPATTSEIISDELPLWA